MDTSCAQNDPGCFRTGLLANERLYEADLETALRMFDPVWDSLTAQERTRLIELLVEQVAYDGVKKTQSG